MNETVLYGMLEKLKEAIERLCF